MAWEENSRICLHMQLIAILSRIGVVYMKMMMKDREQRLIASLVNEKTRLADTTYRFFV